MRVTFVVANYAPSVGGAQLLVQKIAEEFVETCGHSVSVITTNALRSPGGSDPGFLPVGDEFLNGVLVRRRPVARRAQVAVHSVRKVQARMGERGHLRSSELLAAGPLGLDLARSVRTAAYDSDVVVGVSASQVLIPLVALATRGASARAVHLPLLHLSRRPARPTVVRALKSGAATIALTRFERDWLLDAGLPRGDVAVIPPGCDPTEYSSLTPSEARKQLSLIDRPTVGYVGRIALQKGVDTLIKAVERIWVSRPDTNLLLAGSRATWKGFDAIIDRIQPIAGDRLVLRENFEQSEKALLYSACDVIAFPSREESFGIVTLETWCAQRALVASDISALRSVIRNGVDGELVRVDDLDAWVLALDNLLSDEHQRTQLATNGRMRIDREFAWHSVVERWDETLRNVINETPVFGSCRPRIQ